MTKRLHTRPLPHRLSVVQKRMDDHTRTQRERHQIRDRVTRGEIQGRVPVERHGVERRVVSKDSSDVVGFSVSVVWAVSEHGEVPEVPDVGVVKRWGEDPVEHDESDEGVDLGPPGHDERVGRPCDLGPVKGEEGDSEAVDGAKDLVHDFVGRGDPADPVE